MEYLEGSGTERATDKVETDELDAAWAALDAVTEPSYHKAQRESMNSINIRQIVMAMFSWLNSLRDLQSGKPRKAMFILRIGCVQ